MFKHHRKSPIIEYKFKAPSPSSLIKDTQRKEILKNSLYDVFKGKSVTIISSNSLIKGTVKDLEHTSLLLENVSFKFSSGAFEEILEGTTELMSVDRVGKTIHLNEGN